MLKTIKKIFASLLILSICFLSACKKLVEIPPPADSITTKQVFEDSSDVAAAVTGIYSKILYNTNNYYGFCNGAETFYCGLSSDELVPFNLSGDAAQFYRNAMISKNGISSLYFWKEAYSYIYQVNACLEGLEKSNISTSAKNHFVGELKFLRALFYFYLVNLFGDVPYINSTNWEVTSLAHNTNKDSALTFIINDLIESKRFLLEDYSYSNGSRSRVNKFGAGALLARAYLYSKNYVMAEQESNDILELTSQYSLTSLDDVFLANSTESILQWELNASYNPFNATAEGYQFFPAAGVSPTYYLSQNLLGSFESGDYRREIWVDTNDYAGTLYLVPAKYKIGIENAQDNGNPREEYYTVFRLSEQYLIRSEARAEQGKFAEAISDLNVIRERAGLLPLMVSTDKDQVLSLIMHERQIELFAEWGHRWFDLKRSGKIDYIMSTVTPAKNAGINWQPYQQYYPIPITELQLNPNLVQNSGY
jgi:starch-binding outer membrane protein, SusD/RagB family